MPTRCPLNPSRAVGATAWAQDVRSGLRFSTAGARGAAAAGPSRLARPDAATVSSESAD